MAASLGAEQIQQAKIDAKKVADPGTIAVLALSVATITLVRRRHARQ